MATVVTKNFRIKTGENSFSDPINFLSTSVYLPGGKSLDTYLEETEAAISDEQTAREDADTALGNRIDKEIQDRQKAISDEQAAREDADTALGNRIDTLNTNLTNSINSTTSTLTGLINTETQTRESADQIINGKIQTLTENLNGEITQRENSISTLQTTVEENINNINSLKAFLVGENQIEGNASPLADQVQNNLSFIQNLQNLIGANSLEEGALSLLERIISLEDKIATLEGKIIFYIDETKYQTQDGTNWLDFATENGLSCASLTDNVWDADYNYRVFDIEENDYVIGETIIIKNKKYTWLSDQ